MQVKCVTIHSIHKLCLLQAHTYMYTCACVHVYMYTVYCYCTSTGLQWGTVYTRVLFLCRVEPVHVSTTTAETMFCTVCARRCTYSLQFSTRVSSCKYSRYHTQTGTCTYIALSLLKWTLVLPAHYTETTHSNATTQAVPVYTCSISSRVDMSRTQYTGHLYMSSVLQDTTNRSLVQEQCTTGHHKQVTCTVVHVVNTTACTIVYRVYIYTVYGNMVNTQNQHLYV